jgi:hypothetical protein
MEPQNRFSDQPDRVPPQISSFTYVLESNQEKYPWHEKGRVIGFKEKPPDGSRGVVTTILPDWFRPWAFAQSGLEFILLSAGIESIDRGAFAGCQVAVVTIDGANPSFTCENGVLCIKYLSTLLSFPDLKQQTELVTPTRQQRAASIWEALALRSCSQKSLPSYNSL